MIKSIFQSPITARRALLMILLFALCVRLSLVLLLGEEIHDFSGTYDQIAYDLLAQRVVEGYGFSFPIDWYPFAQAGQPTAHWSFLYTLYLSAVYTLFGHHPLAARVIQVFIASLHFILIFRIGRRLFDEKVGLAAAALTACYAYLVLFNASLMTQSFYILAVLASLDIGLALVEKNTWQRWALLGISLGIGILMRQSLLLFVPLLLGWIWWASAPAQKNLRTPFKPLAGIAVAAVIIAAFILPWTIRNYFAFNDFLLLNSNGGYWFYSSNHPGQGIEFDSTFKAPIADDLITRSEPVIDRALMRQGVQFFLDDPVRVAQLSLSRFKDYFWLFPAEGSSNLSNWFRLFSFGLYLPFMAFGLYLSRHRWRMCLPLYLYVALDGIFCLLTWSAPRYRLPSDAILMVFAGLAVTTLAVRFRLVSPIRRDSGAISNDKAVS